MKWIPIKEKLPEIKEDVIVYDKLMNKSYGAILHQDGYFFAEHEGYSKDLDDDCEITHWMPLPEPPEN